MVDGRQWPSKSGTYIQGFKEVRVGPLRSDIQYDLAFPSTTYQIHIKMEKQLLVHFFLLKLTRNNSKGKNTFTRKAKLKCQVAFSRIRFETWDYSD